MNPLLPSFGKSCFPLWANLSSSLLVKHNILLYKKHYKDKIRYRLFFVRVILSSVMPKYNVKIVHIFDKTNILKSGDLIPYCRSILTPFFIFKFSIQTWIFLTHLKVQKSVSLALLVIDFLSIEKNPEQFLVENVNNLDVAFCLWHNPWKEKSFW